MQFLDPETELFVHRLELEYKLGQLARSTGISDQGSSLIRRAQQYWRQIRQRPDKPLAGSLSCCAATLQCR